MIEKDATMPLIEHEITEKMKIEFQQFGNIGIFSLSGKLMSEHEDDLKLLLMRAIHGTDRAVLNFKSVTHIDQACLRLVRNAYLTSIRLKNPLLLTEVSKKYIPELFKGENADPDLAALFPDSRSGAAAGFK